VRAGSFVVHGDHDRDAPRANEIAIEIGAAEAFGTGHHGTTAGCLLAIDAASRSRSYRRALDVGTGSVVLAIAIAKRTKASVLASDIDDRAVAIAAANGKANGVHIRTVRAAGVDAHVFARYGPYDLVAANILAGPLAAMAPSLKKRLAKTATVILSGLLPGQKSRIVSAYRSQGLRLATERILDGWLTLIFDRGSRCRAAPAHRAGGTDGRCRADMARRAWRRPLETAWKQTG
jgi:ribosomal protein L11 methyltransferase